MIDKPRLKKGEGKVQYYACRERVTRLLAAGYSIRAIQTPGGQYRLVSRPKSGFTQRGSRPEWKKTLKF